LLRARIPKLLKPLSLFKGIGCAPAKGVLAKNLAAVQVQMEEHRMLRELIESILGYTRPDSTGETVAGQERHERWIREVRHALALLHESVSVHFRHEEAGMLEASVLESYGSHRDTAARLRDEHTELLSQIGAVRRLADQKGRETEMMKRLNDLCVRLRAHESAENQLVGALFGIEMAG
jgi:hemerythrin